MVYSEVIEGVTVTSNIPFDQVPPSGSLYEIDIHWTLPVAELEQLGYDLQHILGQTSFIDQLVTQGWNGQIKSYNVYTANASTTRVAFIATSPWPYIVAVGAIALLIVVGLYLVAEIAQSITSGVQTPGGQVFLIALGGALLIGVGIFTYGFVKSAEVRKETLKSTAAGIHFTREHVAPAVAGGFSGAASAARRGVEIGRAQLKRSSPESEEA